MHFLPESSSQKSPLWQEWRTIILSGCCFVFGWIFPLPLFGKNIFFVAAYILCGQEVLVKSIKNIIKGKLFDENFLMTLATLGAFAIGEYPEGAAVMLFYQIGEHLQEMAAEKSRNRIIGLMDLRPDTVRIICNGQEKIISPQQAKAGDIIRVRPGERIALDGKIINGQGFLDVSALTGESRPVKAFPNKQILAGSISLDGVFDISVEKNYKNSTLAKIIELAEKAAAKKSKAEKFITRFAHIYTPVVVMIAVMVAFVPPFLLPDTSFKIWIYRALIFLVISCPCALVLSVPIGFFSGIGGAAHYGILIKGGSYLEQLAHIFTLALDKTGTLTQGVFEVTAICPMKGITSTELLSLAARLESYSNHPVAKAILKENRTTITPIDNIQEFAGEGISGGTILAGNKRLMERFLIPDVSNVSGTAIHLAQNGIYKGYLLLGDKLKPTTARAVKELTTMGIKTVILSGDSSSSVKQTAHDLNITQFYSELLPTEKIDVLENIMHNTAKGKITAFAGDGINDAPVITRADVGIAMGALGSDAAIEAADVVLMTDDIQKLVTAIRISRKTLYIIKQNIWMALGVKAAVLTLGLFGLANMWGAVFADVGVSLLAVANSLRTLYFKE